MANHCRSSSEIVRCSPNPTLLPSRTIRLRETMQSPPRLHPQIQRFCPVPIPQVTDPPFAVQTQEGGLALMTLREVRPGFPNIDDPVKVVLPDRHDDRIMCLVLRGLWRDGLDGHGLFPAGTRAWKPNRHGNLVEAIGGPQGSHISASGYLAFCMRRTIKTPLQPLWCL